MARKQNETSPDKNSSGGNASAGGKTKDADIHDSKRDQERLQPDESTIDLPDVKDIPGQEFIHVPRLGELADTTISSADEEGDGLFEEEESTEEDMANDNDISRTDNEVLDNAGLPIEESDDQGLRRASLDKTDLDGERLNESSDFSGSDLDVPGAEQDDRDEAIGEEDEENNSYSMGSDSNDEITEGTP